MKGKIKSIKMCILDGVDGVHGIYIEEVVGKNSLLEIILIDNQKEEKITFKLVYEDVIKIFSYCVDKIVFFNTTYERDDYF